MKPYVIATGATLADTAYMGGIGGGLTLHATVGNVSLDPYGEVVQQSFRNSSFYPLASGLSIHHCAYYRMAGRTWRRSTDLAKTRLGIAAAIPKRDIERSGVLVSRLG
ncbi:MAG: hypothetical protein WB689_36430, partial [Xanthobacteraceae bacterium]